MPPKFCPRCGAFYRNMPSATCPQCFAHLEVLDQPDAVEVELKAEELRRDPEYLEVKAADDEKYKEQAFGGCFGVVVISLVTVIIAAFLIYAGFHRKLPPPPVNQRVSFDAPTTVVPAKLAGIARTKMTVTHRSASIAVTTIRASYGLDIDVFATPSNLTAAEHEAFRLYANMATEAEQGSLKNSEVVAHGADYIVVSRTVETVQRAINELAN